MFYESYLFIWVAAVLVIALSVALTRSPARRKAILGFLPFRKGAPQKSLFLRWLTAEQLDKLKNAGVSCVVHTSRAEGGIVFSAGELSRALRALDARVLATFPTEQSSVDEVVFSFRRKPDVELDALTVSVSGQLKLNSFFFWQSYYANKRICQLIRETILPTVRRNVRVHLMNGRTLSEGDTGDFNIYVWASSTGSCRLKTPERIWGVPTARRDQSFQPSTHGIPIIESASEYCVAELVGENSLYIHFNALTTASETELAVLARLMDALREEMNVGKFLEEIVSSLPADGMPIGVANAGKHSIYDQGFAGRRQDVVKTLVKQILIPAVKSDVFVKQCQGSNQEPLEDGMFHIFFASAPLGRPTVATPERLWNYRLLKSETVFMPSGRGAVIADDDGFPIAEVVGSNLYIYGDLIQYGCSKGSALFAKLLMEVRKELAAMRFPERTRDYSKIFVDQCWRQIANVGKADAKAAVAARQAGDGLTNLLRAARTAEQECYRLESTPSEAIGSEFDELCKIKKVVDIGVTESAIVVKTDTLFCVDPRDRLRHEIGAFIITIPTRQGHPITWMNQTRRCPGHDGKAMNAPHVNSLGHACLGNTKDLFPSLISQREFSSAVELAIAFIESVNTSDTWGKHIDNWPVATG